MAGFRGKEGRLDVLISPRGGVQTLVGDFLGSVAVASG